MPKAFAVRLKLHGPITVQYPTLSTAGGSYPLPPPSTLIGALYYAHAFQTGNYAEVKDINGLRCTPAYEWVKDGVIIDTTAIPIGSVAVTNTLLRLYNWTRSAREEQYTVGYVGLSYVPELIAVYAVSDDWFNELKRSAWGIARLGKREGLVTVIDVGDADLEIGGDRVNSYFPADAVKYKPMKGNSSAFFFPDPRSEFTYCNVSKPMPKLIRYDIVWEGGKITGLSMGYGVVRYGDWYAVLKLS